MNIFKTIERPASAEYKDRGSRFIAYAFPVSTVVDFKARLKLIKEEHPKAVHHCFAYRIGTDGNNFRSSDDGEPSGSAGKPILGQIDSKELTNMGVVVVRYFGGTMLGVPGLINAYKTAASFALQMTPILEKPVQKFFQLEFDYTLQNEVMLRVKKYRAEIVKNDQQLFCLVTVAVPKANADYFESELNELFGVEVKLLPTISSG